jgi:hypothetical protein
MTRRLKILLLIFSLALFAPPAAKAADPIAIAALAPVALRAVQAATPLAVRTVHNTLGGLFQIGKDTFQILYLPYGLGKMTIGAPFGGFRSGLVYTFKGCIATCKLVVHTLLLPIKIIGVETNF